jgi:hypothetical protein
MVGNRETFMSPGCTVTRFVVSVWSRAGSRPIMAPGTRANTSLKGTSKTLNDVIPAKAGIQVAVTQGQDGFPLSRE